jgi:hypothetical protein
MWFDKWVVLKMLLPRILACTAVAVVIGWAIYFVSKLPVERCVCQ